MTNHLLAKIGQYALISNKSGRLLVLERTRSKTWSLPGGRLNTNEDWNSAFIREIKEETNLNGIELKPFEVNIIKDPYQIKYCVYFIVNVQDFANLKISEEHSSFRWIEKSEITELNFEDDKVVKVIKSFLDK